MLKLLTLKQYANLVSHSLSLKQSRIQITCDTLRKLLKVLRKSNKQVMLIQLVDDDQLYSEIKKLGKFELLKSLPSQCLFTIEIKSKLLCDQNIEVSSCSLCECVLTNHFYTLDR